MYFQAQIYLTKSLFLASIDKEMQKYILNSEDIAEVIEGIHYLTQNNYLSELEVENYLLKEVQCRIRYQTSIGYWEEDSNTHYKDLKKFIAKFDQDPEEHDEDEIIKLEDLKVSIEENEKDMKKRIANKDNEDMKQNVFK